MKWYVTGGCMKLQESGWNEGGWTGEDLVILVALGTVARHFAVCCIWHGQNIFYDLYLTGFVKPMRFMGLGDWYMGASRVKDSQRLLNWTWSKQLYFRRAKEGERGSASMDRIPITSTFGWSLLSLDVFLLRNELSCFSWRVFVFEHLYNPLIVLLRV